MIATIRRRWWVAVVAAVTAGALTATAFAQVSGGAYNLSWSALSAGGSSANAPYTEQSVIGQALAGRSSQGQYAIDSGFLGAAANVKYKRIMPNLSGDGLY
jgi:hypothetical protein